MAKGFLLLASYRSGSTWVIDVLNHVRGLSAYSELFAAPQKKAGTEELTQEQSDKTTYYLDQTIRAYPHYYQPGEKRGIRPFSIFSYLDAFYEQEGQNGFKLMYTQLAKHPEIWLYILIKKISIIHLIRQNHLDVIISREMRKVTKTTHRVAGAQESKPAKVTLDSANLVRQLRSLQRNINLARWWIRLSKVRSMEIYYEDLVRDPSSFGMLGKFLQIKDQEVQPQSKLVKLVRGNYEQSIANYDEVKCILQDSEFAPLLNG